ncbi:MAG: ATP-binding protein [Pseudomonadota bacterium]
MNEQATDKAISPLFKRIVLLVTGVAIGVAGFVWADAVLQKGLYSASATLIVVSLALIMADRQRVLRKRAEVKAVSNFIRNDSSPSFIVDLDGEIAGLNDAAKDAFPALVGETLAGVLRNTFANPEGIIFRLRSKAGLDGSAREDIVTRQGHVRLTAYSVGASHLLWRLETLADGPVAGRSAEGPGLPMIMVGRGGAVLFMNDIARTLIGQRVRSLDRIFNAVAVENGTVVEVMTENGVRDCLVCEVDAGAGRRAIYLLPAPEWNKAQDLGDHNALPVALLRISAQGAVQSFNRTAAAMVGPGLTEGVYLSEIMEGLGRPMTDWLAETVGGRAVQQTEFLRLKRQDKEMFVQVALGRLIDDGEVSVVAVLTDATELKTLEAQFVQSQKMQAIGQLAGGVAHDFNNLLTAISGHCDLLLLRHDQGDADYGDLVQINQNANRAAALVGQLLAFSRKQTLRPEVLDLRDTLSDLTHLLNRLVGEKVSLTLSHDPVLKTIRADKRQLEQVLMNLVVNARDAMPEGGEIRIETEGVSLTAPFQRDRVMVPEGEYVALRVIDHGVGIPKDKLQKVFEPFYTTKRTGEGTGLGLSTAYGIVKQTGGFIFVDSEVGSGTSFTLMFPVLAEAPATVVQQLSEPVVSEPKHGDGVILLVEDEAPVRAFASRALRLRGYTVLEADSAEAALKTLEDKSLAVDLFVTDVVMPGKDGPSWVREALKNRPDVRVVFVSGYAEDRLTDDQAEIPNSVFLPKPFSLNDLTETVHKQLH